MDKESNENKYVGVMPEATPNPASYKFVLDRQVAPHGGVDFPGAQGLDRSPLAQRLFEESGVTGVYIGPNFITVSQAGNPDWEKLAGKFEALIREHLSEGRPVLADDPAEDKQVLAEGVKPETELEKKINEILDSQVRPAVAGDGGDIIFGGFKDGVLRLHLQGSCSGCPSSTQTLKMGIERLMHSQIPEVVKVEAI